MAEIELAFDPPLARIKLNRPERRNAMSRAMWLGLADAASEIYTRNDVKIVLVEGVGGNFCSGADISEFDSVFAYADSARDYLAAIEKGLTALARLDRPTIALF